METQKVIIYSLADPRDRLVRYIGKTKQSLINRMYCHVSNHRLDKETSYKNSWIKSLKKAGFRPIAETIEEVPIEEWEYWEQFYIQLFLSWGFPLTNMTKGGEGSNGGKGSLGYKHTKEAKHNIAIKNSLVEKTEDWINKIRKANSKPINQYTLDNILVRNWDSTTEAAIQLGDIDYKKNINSVIKGRRNHAYGYIWKEAIEIQDKELV